jgi:hypothetical protein
MKSYLFEKYLFGFCFKKNVFCLVTELIIRLKLKNSVNYQKFEISILDIYQFQGLSQKSITW